MNSAGRGNISSIFQHGLQDGYLSLNPHVKGGLFPLIIDYRGREGKHLNTGPVRAVVGRNVSWNS